MQESMGQEPEQLVKVRDVSFAGLAARGVAVDDDISEGGVVFVAGIIKRDDVGGGGVREKLFVHFFYGGVGCEIYHDFFFIVEFLNFLS